MILFMAKEK